VQAINDLTDFISFLPLTSNVIRLFGITMTSGIYGMMTTSFGMTYIQSSLKVFKDVRRCFISYQAIHISLILKKNEDLPTYQNAGEVYARAE
jgi:hypothetical protein